MGWMGIVLTSVIGIIVGIILIFLTPILKKPRDKFITWIQKIFAKKKREVVISDLEKKQKLKNLIQVKYSREKEKFDPELNKNIRDIMEKFSMNGILYSSPFLKKVIELHTDRSHKLLEARKNINREVLLKNKTITSDEEIKLAMQDLEKIAVAMKFEIFGCDNVLYQMNAKDSFLKEMDKNISRILSDIRRDLTIEKDENLLLKKRRPK